MKPKSLSAKNPYLKSATARRMRVRSLASSTAIETSKSIRSIEAKLTRSKHSVRRRISLA